MTSRLTNPVKERIRAAAELRARGWATALADLLDPFEDTSVTARFDSERLAARLLTCPNRSHGRCGARDLLLVPVA